MSAWTYQDFVADAKSRIREQDCESIRKAQKAQRAPFLLDVREMDEMEDGFLEGAVHLPRGLVEKHIWDHLSDPKRPVCVYCSTGNRSALVVDAMQRMGFEDVTNLSGGIARWKQLGYPTTGASQTCLMPGGRISWAQVRREFAIVARRVPVLGSGTRNLVYLDHAASTHAPMSVLNAYTEFHQHEYANVHRGAHMLSRKATERYEEAYYVVADFLGADLKQGAVCFTQNTTHAIDLASHALADRPGKVITTELEHHSNELPHRARGTVLRARVTEDGRLDMDHLGDLLRRNEVKLVAVSAGSNVTGFMPDIHEVARMAHDAGALILVDAAQALARTPIDVRPFDDPAHLDFVAGAGHKAYAPFGAGFLYGPRDVLSEAPPYLAGGGTATQVTPRSASFLNTPDRHHGGTPNIAGVVGMARALLFIQAIGRDEIRRHETELTQKVLGGLAEMGGITVYGPRDAEARLGVVSFNVEGADDLLTAAVLSEEGALAVRNGRFCAHIYVDRLLRSAHSTSGTVPTGAVRASVGLYNDTSDVDRLLEYVKKVRERQWVGRYRVAGNTVSAEFAGRCADRWMESTSDPDAGTSDLRITSEDFDFEVFHADEASRAYLVSDRETREAAIIDPVREHVDQYLDHILANQLRLVYTIETHTHADHLSGSMRLKDLTGCTMVMHDNATAPCVDRPVIDGEVIALGSVRMECLATPGHTADAMCILLSDRILTGDTLLIGGCGRTDLPSGDARALYRSLQRLKELPEATLVFPGHDYNGRRASTIGREMRSNARLGLKEDDFIKTMASLALPKPLRLKESLHANRNCL